MPINVTRHQVDIKKAVEIEKTIIANFFGKKIVEIEMALIMAYADVAEGLNKSDGPTMSSRKLLFVESSMKLLAENVVTIMARSDDSIREEMAKR